MSNPTTTQTTAKVIQGTTIRDVYLEGVTLESLSERLSPGTKLSLNLGKNEELVDVLDLRRGYITTLAIKVCNVVEIHYHALVDGQGRLYLHEQFRDSSLRGSQHAAPRYKKLKEAGMIQ